MSFTELTITYYAHEQILILIACGLMVAALVGALADRLIGPASFGTFGNACLIGLAMVVAIVIDSRDLAHIVPENSLRIGLIAATIATGLLLTMATLRSWLDSHTG